MALSVPLSRFTSQVGGGSAFFVRPRQHTTTQNMFTKHDIEFEEMAADSVRRSAVIASLSWRRVVVFWGALAFMVAAFLEDWGGRRDALTILSAAIFFTLYVKMESDLRFLRLIDRLQKGGDAKTTA